MRNRGKVMVNNTQESFISFFPWSHKIIIIKKSYYIIILHCFIMIPQDI